MQVNSSISRVDSSTIYMGQTSPEGETTIVFQSQETVIGIESGTPDSDAADGMAVLLGGEATAVGEDTVALGVIEGQIADVGTGLIAEGSATFAATGQTPEEGIAFASADSYAVMTEADTIVVAHAKTSEIVQTAEGSVWTEMSQTEVLAADVEVSSSLSHSLEAGTGTDENPAAQSVYPETTATHSEDNAWDPVDGNLGIIVLDVQAYAEDSLVIVEASALTVEDQLSVVSGYALFGVG